MESVDKEVYFGQYCSSCTHKDLKESQEPCYDCLNNPVMANSHKPLHYKEKDCIGIVSEITHLRFEEIEYKIHIPEKSNP